MIVWINGAFGVGKTSVAREVVRRWKGSTLLDPERLGFVLGLLPSSKRGDFQDLLAWRRWTVRTSSFVARLGRHVVVPMTLVRPDYFEEIVGVLRQREEVRHVTLVAPKEMIRARLRARGTGLQWGESQLDRCVGELADPRFAEHVSTAGRSVVEIADLVIASARR